MVRLLSIILFCLCFIPIPAFSQNSAQDPPPVNATPQALKEKYSTKRVIPDASNERIATSELLVTSALSETVHYRAHVNRTPVYDRHDVIPPFDIVSFSYEADGPSKDASRPVFFLFNGGPGSSTIWLHMTGFGPEKVSLDLEASSNEHLQLTSEANPGFLIDIGDLVFVDPVGTGLSKPKQDVSVKEYADIRLDARSMCRFAETWLEAQGREDSPIYLIGSSYGALRIAGMASHSICGDMRSRIEGMVFISGLLDLRARATRSPFRVMGSFPTWASIIWEENGSLRKQWNDDKSAFITAAKSLANEEIGPAMFEELVGTTESMEQRRNAVLDFLGRENHQGMTTPNPNMESIFASRKREGKPVCLYDIRFTCSAGANLPSKGLQALGDALEVRLAAHLATTLNFNLDTDSYVIFLDHLNRVNWGYNFHKSLDGGKGTNMAEALASSMKFISNKRNRQGLLPSTPRLMIASGHYDIVTPFYAIELSLIRAGFKPDSLWIRTYESGHMMYAEKKTGHQLAADIRSFVLNAD